MKKRSKIAVLAATALISLAFTAIPAQASTTYTVDCPTTGASGAATVNGFYSTITGSFGVTLAVYDSSADGHHVSVRLIGKGPGGTPVNWSWHANYDGAGTTQAWNTTAQYSSGLVDVGVQVARFEGDTLLNSCTKWVLSDSL
ncbi:hypothetical protein [Streptomyces spiralis]|uniref:hypothetical protein n=1 Tax=Streptomyces spiralis TaxID=66376 RepID=UPI0036CE6092